MLFKKFTNFEYVTRSWSVQQLGCLILNNRIAIERYFQTFLQGEISLLVANRSQFFVI